MFEDALRYPLESGDRVATLVLGGLLIFPGSLLVLPLFVLQGYLVRVLRSAAHGETVAPSFTDWGSLFVDGVKLMLVNLVVGLIISIPIAVTTMGFLGGAMALDDAGAESAMAALGLFGVLAVGLLGVVTILLLYFLPAMFANFAVEERIRAAFAFPTVKSVAFTSDYFIGVLLGVVVGGVINTIAGPFLLVLIGLPMIFYGQVVTYYLFGRAYAEGRAASGLTQPAGSVPATERSGGV